MTSTDAISGTYTVAGLRYYPGPDGVTEVRSSGGTLTYQISTTQGTANTTVDASSLAVTRRYFDPYGNSRGTQPANWTDNHGYLGQPADTTTGLDLLGARNYDPTQGRFLTADPILEAGDPSQMGGYTYAADNPTTGSDPSGTIFRVTGGDYGNLGPAGGGEDAVGSAGRSDGGTQNSSGGTSSAPGIVGAITNFLSNWLPEPTGLNVVRAILSPDGGGLGPGIELGDGGSGGDTEDQARAPQADTDAPDVSTPHGAMEEQLDTRGDDRAAENEIRAEAAEQEATALNDERGEARAQKERADTQAADGAAAADKASPSSARSGAGGTPSIDSKVASNASSRPALPRAMREPPNAAGSKITSRLAAAGEEFNMVISLGQPPSRPGGFGTFEDIPSQEFVRDQLAIRTDWKSDVSLVQRYAIPSGDPIRIQESIIGPQDDPKLGYLPGGATQVEILNFEDRARLILVGDPREIP